VQLIHDLHNVRMAYLDHEDGDHHDEQRLEMEIPKCDRSQLFNVILIVFYFHAHDYVFVYIC